MKQTHEQQFTVNPRTLEVLNLTTGERHQTADLAEMMKLHRNLELAAKAPAKASDKMARRDERKQAGV